MFALQDHLFAFTGKKPSINASVPTCLKSFNPSAFHLAYKIGT